MQITSVAWQNLVKLRSVLGMAIGAALFSSILVLSFVSPIYSLSSNYYDKTCPNAELIIANAVKSAAMKDKTVPAALLRMHFHDCFVRVCKHVHSSLSVQSSYAKLPRHQKWTESANRGLMQGCDASVLLNSKGSNKAEKDGPPNVSLHAFYVIDNAKKDLEASCPGVVSCADILALAARDSVVLVKSSPHPLCYMYIPILHNRSVAPS